MMHHPFQIARWALFASFAVMVFVVTFPSPSPGPAWILAKKSRDEQRFPHLRKRTEPMNPPAAQLANRPTPVAEPAEGTNAETSETPFRTAQLPARLESGDSVPRGVRIQEPIFFEDDRPAENQLAPDPAYLDTPPGAAMR